MKKAHTDPTKKNIYVSVVYDDDYSKKEYAYKTTYEDIKEGDTVLVDRNGNEAYGIVKKVGVYYENELPYPLDKTKDVIKIIDSDDEFDDEDDDYYDPYDDYRKLNDYEHLLLNNMFGRISIKRLMRLNSPKNGEEEKQLFYYPKFNTFFYKNAENEYSMAEYDNNLITYDMFRIIEKESVEVLQKRYAMTSDKESYVRAVEFCQKNLFPFHDDTDILEFREEKEKLYRDKPKAKEPEDFESIEEIKKYLKDEYKEAYWKTPDPSYYIEGKRIIHYMGWLQYDMRVFKIFDFLIKNKYVDEKYYNLENKKKYRKEHWANNIETLDLEKVSYILLDTLHSERVNEGLINAMIKTGSLQKLIERAEQLKGSD